MAPEEAETIDPDASVAGLMGRKADALRYADTTDYDPHESPGIIRSFTPSNVRVLDVGAGAGGYTLMINQGKNNSVICIEPDVERAASARAKGLTVHQGVLDENFIRSQPKFDVVILGDVLEHVVDPSELLGLAKRCLDKEGRIIVSVPNVAHWTVRLKLLFGRFNYKDVGIMDATHLRWFTRKTLTQLVENSGFEILGMKHSAGLWMWEYRRLPIRLIPGPIRKLIVVSLLPIFPNLLGVQHVLIARVINNP